MRKPRSQYRRVTSQPPTTPTGGSQFTTVPSGVSAVASRVREARWHPSERVEATDDGSLTWRATVAGPIEIRLWILSWGADVEVLEPATLRADVASTHVRAARQYEPR
jgi:predicted DNA-binding transcriptional regulator YafY